MGMFGKGFSDKLATFGATLSDVGGALNNTGSGNLERLQARRKADAQELERKARMQELSAMFGGGQQPPAPGQSSAMPPAYGSGGEASKAGYVPEVPPVQSQAQAGPQIDWQKLIQAQIAGVDINPYVKIYEMMQPSLQQVNMPDGSLGVIDQKTGQTRQVAANPYAELERTEREARIRALDDKTNGIQIIEGKDGLYEYDPKTKEARKLKSWAAYAPQRGSSGGRGAVKVGAHEPPPGGKFY